MGRACSTYARENRNAYSFFVGKPEEKTPRLTCKLEDNIEVDLREIKLSVIDWINRVEHRDECRTLVNLCFP
jgi:hypothetical protein